MPSPSVTSAATPPTVRPCQAGAGRPSPPDSPVPHTVVALGSRVDTRSPRLNEKPTPGRPAVGLAPEEANVVVGPAPRVDTDMAAPGATVALGVAPVLVARAESPPLPTRLSPGRLFRDIGRPVVVRLVRPPSSGERPDDTGLRPSRVRPGRADAVDTGQVGRPRRGPATPFRARTQATGRETLARRPFRPTSVPDTDGTGHPLETATLALRLPLRPPRATSGEEPAFADTTDPVDGRVGAFHKPKVEDLIPVAYVATYFSLCVLP